MTWCETKYDARTFADLQIEWGEWAEVAGGLRKIGLGGVKLFFD
jgi:hypothetical protein